MLPLARSAQALIAASIFSFFSGGAKAVAFSGLISMPESVCLI